MFLALGHIGGWCKTAQGASFFQEVIAKSILYTFKHRCCRNAAAAAAAATGCCYCDDTLLRHIVCPRFMLGAVSSALTGDLTILLFASEGHSPSSVCSWAWICSSGALWMCDSLPRRGVIPKGSRSNRVIYYTVQLLLPHLLHPLLLSFSLLVSRCLCPCISISWGQMRSRV